MALMTNKMAIEMEDIFHARHGLPEHLSEFIVNSHRMLRRDSENFTSRRAIQQYIDTLSDLITTKVNHP